MIRTLDDLRALEAFFDRSEVLWVAVLTLDGAIVTASASLEYVAGGPLSGRRFAELIHQARRQ